LRGNRVEPRRAGMTARIRCLCISCCVVPGSAKMRILRNGSQLQC